MKEILQTKYLNLKINLACASAHILSYSCIVHVEYVDQEPVAIEEEAAAEDQEEQQLRSWRWLTKSKNKTLLILLTPTSSQASTGSIQTQCHNYI